MLRATITEPFLWKSVCITASESLQIAFFWLPAISVSVAWAVLKQRQTGNWPLASFQHLGKKKRKQNQNKKPLMFAQKEAEWFQEWVFPQEKGQYLLWSSVCRGFVLQKLAVPAVPWIPQNIAWVSLLHLERKRQKYKRFGARKGSKPSFRDIEQSRLGETPTDHLSEHPPKPSQLQWYIWLLKALSSQNTSRGRFYAFSNFISQFPISLGCIPLFPFLECLKALKPPHLIPGELRAAKSPRQDTHTLLSEMEATEGTGRCQKDI